MLHEVFLALSGHPSSLFETTSTKDFPHVTPAESALLESIGHLAELHRVLRERLARISEKHSSLICRAVATSIRSTHLARFQRDIVDVERGILLKNPEHVGAYDIVPLANIAAQFEPWKRRLEWYQHLSLFMSSTANGGPGRTSAHSVEAGCNGAQLLNKLQQDRHTGFRDIAEVATELTAIAESSWIRLLAQWLATGQLSPRGFHDFFIQHRSPPDHINPDLVVDKDLLPGFVTDATASSILFLGKTLKMLQSTSATASSTKDQVGQIVTGPSGLLPSTQSTVSSLQSLTTMPSPFTATRLSRTIDDMRKTIAQEVVARVLPIHSFLRVITRLRQFLLVGRGDFVDALIQEADRYLANRHQQLQTGSKPTTSLTLAGVMMKEGEAKAVLSRTFTALAPFISKDKLVDDGIEWAKEHATLRIAGVRSSKEVMGAVLDLRFRDFLLLTPVELSLRLDPTYDLFLNQTDLATYSAINSYLVAIRRGHNHLSDLWRISSFRRDLPAPIRDRRLKDDRAFDVLRGRRKEFVSKTNRLKKAWLGATSAVSLLAELGTYLSDEVIEQSWLAFRRWAVRNDAGELGAGVEKDFGTSTASTSSAITPGLPHDPEILSQGHRQYLAALANMLLLSNTAYTKALRALLGHIDHFVPLMHRLQATQKNADLQAEGVYEGSTRDYGGEVSAILSQVDQASEKLRTGTQGVIEQLRRSSGDLSSSARGVHGDTGFHPFSNIAGVDRLLVRLDFRVEGENVDSNG